MTPGWLAECLVIEGTRSHGVALPSLYTFAPSLSFFLNLFILPLTAYPFLPVAWACNDSSVTLKTKTCAKPWH